MLAPMARLLLMLRTGTHRAGDFLVGLSIPVRLVRRVPERDRNHREQRSPEVRPGIDVITLGVIDPEGARRFCQDGLGCALAIESADGSEPGRTEAGPEST